MDKTLSTYSYSQDTAISEISEYLRDFLENQFTSFGGYLIVGAPGIGKTHIKNKIIKKITNDTNKDKVMDRNAVIERNLAQLTENIRGESETPRNILIFDHFERISEVPKYVKEFNPSNDQWATSPLNPTTCEKFIERLESFIDPSDIRISNETTKKLDISSINKKRGQVIIISRIDPARPTAYSKFLDDLRYRCNLKLCRLGFPDESEIRVLRENRKKEIKEAGIIGGLHPSLLKISDEKVAEKNKLDDQKRYDDFRAYVEWILKENARIMRGLAHLIEKTQKDVDENGIGWLIINPTPFEHESDVNLLVENGVLASAGDKIAFPGKKIRDDLRNNKEFSRFFNNPFQEVFLGLWLTLPLSLAFAFMVFFLMQQLSPFDGWTIALVTCVSLPLSGLFLGLLIRKIFV